MILPLCIEPYRPVTADLYQPNNNRSRCAAVAANGGLVLAASALGLAVYLTPLKDWLADGALIKARLAVFGFAAPLVFTMGSALLTVIGAPRLLVCSLGGMAFGFAVGLLWSQLGTLLGSYLIFLFIRWKGRDYALHRFPRLREYSQGLDRHGLSAVVLIRQLPINGFYNNVLLGLTPVSHGEFLMGSLMGYLPLGITACLFGAGLIQRDLIKGVEFLALGLGGSVILGLFLNRQFKKLAEKRIYDLNQ